MSDEIRNENGAKKISAFVAQTGDISPNNSSKIKSALMIQLYFDFDNFYQ